MEHDLRTLAAAGLLMTASVLLAQDYPASTGFCSVTASGVEGCEWRSGPSPKSGLFVTRYRLAQKALLTRGVTGCDDLIIAESDADLINEATNKPVHVSKGNVVLMRAKEDYRLRNVGTSEATVLVIQNREPALPKKSANER